MKATSRFILGVFLMPSSSKRNHSKPNTKQAQGETSQQQPRPRYKPFGLAPEQIRGLSDDNTPKDVEMQVVRLAYERIMLEVKQRMDCIRLLSTEKFTTPYQVINIETNALNFRKIAELILFATLVGHEEEYSRLYDNIDKEWQIGRIISRIKEINPNYYPEPRAPTRERDETTGVVMLQSLPEGTWLTEDELRDMYDQCIV